MAKTALLAQNDDLVIENLKAHVGKSVFDLSHSVTFPIDVDGAILPICCIETVPSDSFEISVECLLRQLSPLKVPLMTNLRLNTAFYYCDNRLAWKKWERFMTGGRSGNELYDIPRMANTTVVASGQVRKFDVVDFSQTTVDTYYRNINFQNTLHTYFGISLNHGFDILPSYSNFEDWTSELPLAFPFFDYQIICRDYYTNVDRLPDDPLTGSSFYDYEDLNSDWAYSNLFPSDDDEIRLVDGPQAKSGFNTGDDTDNSAKTKGFLLDKVRYHDVRPDYFTSSKKAPMRGTPPALSAQSKLILPSGTEITLENAKLSDEMGFTNTPVKASWTSPGGTTYKDLTVKDGSPNVVLLDDITPTMQGSGIWVDTSNFTNFSGEVAEQLELAGLLQANWTAADIRLLSQLSVWQELNMLHDPYYDDFLNAHFDNVRVGESAVEKPQYIGGTSQLISINEILQTSQTTTGENGSPLGNQGATAMSLASNFVGRYYCNNYGFIIGVCYIMPELLYKPAKPRWSSRITKEDYYSPEFANLSMQATLNKEIFFSNDNLWNNTPWGYTGAFDELRSIPNRIAGDLLNPSYATDLGHWVLTRNMSDENKPAMIHNWLSLKGNVDDTAWQHQSMPKFMLQCANYIKAVRPMPKIAIPKAL